MYQLNESNKIRVEFDVMNSSSTNIFEIYVAMFVLLYCLIPLLLNIYLNETHFEKVLISNSELGTCLLGWELGTTCREPDPLQL